MLIRIVKMTFSHSGIDAFKLVFESVKDKIRHFYGCEYLELWQDQNNPKVFFTYSHWQSEEHLENYRKSALFADTWAKTKIHFEQKAEAWSVNKLHALQ